MWLQRVSKILTPCRMLQKTWLIAKINLWTNSFQNMCDMLLAKIDRLARKIDYLQKTPQHRLFWWTQIWVTWHWKDLDAKRLTRVQLLGYPWKLWGMTVQNSYVEGWWRQNWGHTSLLHFFPSGHGNSRKGDFCVKRFVPENFQQEFFLGLVPTKSLRTQDSENVFGLRDRASVLKL